MTSLASLTRPIMLVATTAALCAGVGVATGAIPSREGQIHGCFQKTDGALRVIDAEEPLAGCKRSVAPIAWKPVPGEQG